MVQGFLEFGDFQGLQEREGGAEVKASRDFGQGAQSDLEESLAVLWTGFTVAFGQVEDR